ncbi:OmpA family protein [Paraburkholderia sp. J12]|uniref:OmpA family protein n=1 Tax=Paraburkholderia sp. J12 TaxID=2805432 RepID=UPI002ABDD1E9|nr:OmpA family protein [Paraburkholderia sp. J12]
MKKAFAILATLSTFLVLAGCAASSGITYSIRDVKLADGQPAWLVSCDGLIGGGEMCRQHAERFCAERANGNHAHPIQDAGPLGRTADGQPNTRVMLFQCAVPQAPVAVTRPAPVEAPAPAPTLPPVILRRVSLAGDTSFETGSSSLRPAAIQKLDRILADAHGATLKVVHIDGYTDSRGSDALNMRLSTDRAQRVAQYLRENGLQAQSFVVIGHGKAEPVADNVTAEGRAQNRRVEISSSDR